MPKPDKGHELTDALLADLEKKISREYAQAVKRGNTMICSDTHCKNCGAPLNPLKTHCEYCGIYYNVNDDRKLEMDRIKSELNRAVFSAAQEEQTNRIISQIGCFRRKT